MMVWISLGKPEDCSKGLEGCICCIHCSLEVDLGHQATFLHWGLEVLLFVLWQIHSLA